VTDDLPRLIERARAGDASTLPQLRQLLASPAAVDRWGGNLADLAFVQAAAGKNLLAREALLRKLELLRAELAGPSPTALERLLVERVVACWLQLQDADVRFAQGQHTLKSVEIDYFQRRMDRAHHRFLSAVKALALVRRLDLPVLIAQVNLHAGVRPEPAAGASPDGQPTPSSGR
jgi:hypothetical protein